MESINSKTVKGGNLSYLFCISEAGDDFTNNFSDVECRGSRGGNGTCARTIGDHCSNDLIAHF